MDDGPPGVRTLTAAPVHPLLHISNDSDQEGHPQPQQPPRQKQASTSSLPQQQQQQPGLSAFSPPSSTFRDAAHPSDPPQHEQQQPPPEIPPKQTASSFTPPIFPLSTDLARSQSMMVSRTLPHHASTRKARYLTLDVGEPLSLDIPAWLLSDMEKSTSNAVAAANTARGRRTAASTHNGRKRSISVPSVQNPEEEKEKEKNGSPTASSPESETSQGTRLSRSRSMPVVERWDISDWGFWPGGKEDRSRVNAPKVEGGRDQAQINTPKAASVIPGPPLRLSSFASADTTHPAGLGSFDPPLSATLLAGSPSQVPLSAGQANDYISSRPRNLAEPSPPLMHHGSWVDQDGNEDRYYGEGSAGLDRGEPKGKFWKGFKRSVSDNFAKLRTSRSTVDFKNLPGAGRESGIGIPPSAFKELPETPGRRDGAPYLNNKLLDPFAHLPPSSPSGTDFRGVTSPLSPGPPTLLSKRLSVGSFASSVGGRSTLSGGPASMPSSLPPLPPEAGVPRTLNNYFGAGGSGVARQSPAPPVSLDDVEPERFAQLLKKHKEANVDKVTGSLSIPKRSSSYFTGVVTGNGGGGGGSFNAPPWSSGDASSGGSSPRNSPLNSPSLRSPTGTLPYVRPATGLLDSPTLPRIDHSLHRPATPTDLPSTSRMSSPRASLHTPSTPKSSRDDNFSDAFDSSPATARTTLPRSPVSVKAVPVPVPPPTSSAKGGYKKMEPATVGRLLFHESLPEITFDRISEVLGKNDDFHKTILASYMACFDFAGQEIDEGFRALANHLLVTGESQIISRIIESFAHTWWDCNPQMWPAFLHKDVAETIMNSIMLLNTDLHIANATVRSRRITKKQWVVNLLSYITELSTKEAWIDGSADNRDTVRVWSRTLEGILKRTYDRTAKHPLPQREIPKISLESSGAESLSPDMLSPTSSGFPDNTRRMHRDTSSLSLASTLSTGTMFSIADNGNNHGNSKRRAFGFRRKGDRAPKENRLSYGDSNSSHALSLDSQLNLTNVPPASISLGRHSVNGVLQHEGGKWPPSDSQQQTQQQHLQDPSSLQQPPRYIPRVPSAGDIQLDGQLIRKHLNERDDVKAKHRQWVKLDCALKLDVQAGTLELIMERLEKDAKDTTGFTSATPPPVPHTVSADDTVIPVTRVGTSESAKSGGASSIMGARMSAWTGPTGERARVSSESALPKPHSRGKEQVQTFNLLHSLATPLPPPGYSQLRPHVFTLRLSDGQIYLFHGINAETVREWVRTINMWAARKSKEPLVGSGGNAEFGWGPLLWERAQRKEKDRMERNLMANAGDAAAPGSGIAAGTPPTSNLSPLASGPKYASSMRSFASATSVESGRSAATVTGTTTTAGGGGGINSDANKELAKRLKRMKVTEWMPPVPLGKIMSSLPEDQQRHVWKRQQDLILAEIEEHSGYRDGLDKLYVAHPALKQKSQVNWMRKQRWLMREYEKYGTYAQLCNEAAEAANAAAAAAGGGGSPEEMTQDPLASSITPARPASIKRNRSRSVGPVSGHSPDRVMPFDQHRQARSSTASPQSAVTASSTSTNFIPAHVTQNHIVASPQTATPIHADQHPLSSSTSTSAVPLPRDLSSSLPQQSSSPPTTPPLATTSTTSTSSPPSSATITTATITTKPRTAAGTGSLEIISEATADDTATTADQSAMASETRPRPGGVGRRNSLGATTLLSSSSSSTTDQQLPFITLQHQHLHHHHRNNTNSSSGHRLSKDSEGSFRTAESGAD
ncbi:hypothetical protein PhCBS80983_g02892 [Powellomyces hirtus]|uniref:SEC7 domain-containing protein n=1 Tax=Powellomyces hirtus TaxID=109895 RepID=A0A507E4M5_9FUNG|nr:hypothetical protein PhCBS80983_g02892 [Powellomyces hirtus]